MKQYIFSIEIINFSLTELLFSLEMLQRLTKGPNNWSLSEVVHAIVLLSHFHSLSSFVFSCGLTQELDPISSQKYNKRKDSGNSSPPSRFGFGRSNSNSSILGNFWKIIYFGKIQFAQII